MTTTSTLRERLAFYEQRAQVLGLPVEVVEYGYELATEYPNPREHHVVRASDERGVKRLLRGQAHVKDAGATYVERFYWNGETYLIGFTYDR